MEKHLSDADILEINNDDENRRKKKDRRVAINSCVDPCMDRRTFDRRHKDRKEKLNA